MNKRKDYISHIPLLIYFLLVSFVLMLLCTRSSFLYPYNNWDDANSYLTMGKSMMHGIRIYRDIFDQKGPWLYFLYGLCSLVSRTSFKGVFIMEILWGVFDLCCMYRILRLFMKKETAVFLLPVLFAVSYSSWAFYWGGSAEELCLPFMLLPLFYLLRHYKTRPSEPVPTKEIFISGLCCGVTAGIKFTLLGFYFAFMLMVLFSCLAAEKSGEEGGAGAAAGEGGAGSRFAHAVSTFLKDCGIFLLAMALPFVPWIIFFIATGTLDDFYRVYIYTNVFLYSSFGANDKGESLYDRVYNLAKLLYWLIWDNLQFFLFIITGFFYMLFRKNSGFLLRIVCPVLFFFTFLGIYVGGAHLPYYALPLTVFAAAGFILAGRLIEPAVTACCAKLKSLSKERVLYIFPALSLCVSLLLAYRFSANSFYLSFDKEDVFLTSFAEDIKRDNLPEPTLLNYNCFDCGLYTVADIYPTCYWFQTQTLPVSDILDEQYRFIREGITDYVVTRDNFTDLLYEKYEMIDSFHQIIGPDGWEFDYYLFRRKDL